MNIAVIGAGNGGQAIAGYLAMQGYMVHLYDRNEKKIEVLKNIGSIILKGKINGVGKITLYSSNIEDVIKNARAIIKDIHSELDEAIR